MATRFRPREDFENPLRSGYRLLPFNFTALNNHEYVATNQAGQYVIVDRATLEDFVRHKLPYQSDAYSALKSAHFLIDADSDVALDLLALKVRTKNERFAKFTGLHIFVASLRCEHACPYCQVSRQSDDRVAFDMSRETADRALIWSFDRRRPQSRLSFKVVNHY